MTEKDMRDHINAFLRSKLQGVLLPASMGLGLALVGCGSSALESNPDGTGNVQSGGGGSGGKAGIPGGLGGIYMASGGNVSGGASGRGGFPGAAGGMYMALGRGGTPGAAGGVYMAPGGSPSGSGGIGGTGGSVGGSGGSPTSGGVSGTAGSTEARDSGRDAPEGDSTKRRDALVSESNVALGDSSND